MIYYFDVSGIPETSKFLSFVAAVVPRGDCCENLKWVMQGNNSITYAKPE